MADFQIEKRIIKRGFRAIAGVDEAGRGAIFGPVVAAAVILPPVLIGPGLSGWAEEIDDSNGPASGNRCRNAKVGLYRKYLRLKCA